MKNLPQRSDGCISNRQAAGCVYLLSVKESVGLTACSRLPTANLLWTLSSGAGSGGKCLKDVTGTEFWLCVSFVSYVLNNLPLENTTFSPPPQKHCFSDRGFPLTPLSQQAYPHSSRGEYARRGREHGCVFQFSFYRPPTNYPLRIKYS